MGLMPTPEAALENLLKAIWDHMSSGMEERIARIESGWNHHIPAFLAAAGSVRAFGHELLGIRRDLAQQIASLQREIESLSQRVDGLAGVREPQPTTAAGIPPPEKVALTRPTGLKLNLDCGRGPREGFINIGSGPMLGVDLLADPGDLPFERGSVQEIDSGRLPDAIAQKELSRRLLPSWYALIAPGGRFRAVVRDASAMLESLADGKCSFDEFRAALLEGDSENLRGNIFTHDSLKQLLEEAGFINIDVVECPGQDQQRPEFEISAERPLS